MSDDRKEALTAAFEAANYRKPTPKEQERINNAVDNRGKTGRPKKGK